MGLGEKQNINVSKGGFPPCAFINALNQHICQNAIGTVSAN